MGAPTLGGPIAAREVMTGSWELVSASGEAVYLRGVAAEQRGALLRSGIDRIVLEWHAAGVRVVIHATGHACLVHASSAIVHRPDSRVYDGLPFATFDAAARRFWRRVFRLMRLPGGRQMVGWIARRGAQRARVGRE